MLSGFFGILPVVEIPLYGPVGIVIAETLFAFPQAVLILSIALKSTDTRLYEAAESLGAGLGMSLHSAIWGTLITFAIAYLIEKTREMPLLRQTAYFLALLPLALPGLVIGLSYIFFFNARGWQFGPGIFPTRSTGSTPP